MLAESTPVPVWPRIELAALAVGAIAVVVAVSTLAAHDPAAGLLALFGSATVAVVVARPVRAAFLYLAITPLIVGLPRGAFAPHLRANEALLALLVAGVALRLIVDGLGGRQWDSVRDWRITDLDRSIAAMAVLSSIVPLAWRAGRGYRPELDDLLFATTLWKYLLVFLLFRLVVVDEQHVRTCVKVLLGVGVVVGATAIAQALNVPGVPQLLAAVQDEPLNAVANNRGSSTLGTSHGVADVMAFNLSFALAFWWLRVGPRWLAALGICFFGVACLASGQFSAAVALLVVAVAFGWLTRRLLRTLATAVLAAALAGVLLWPVIQARLASTDESGLPSSWAARRFNLTNYFWPELLRGGNWVLGVRPAGRLPSYEPWRDFVYIESGHTWLLWTGGVPLALAFAWFSWSAFRASLALAEQPLEAEPPAGSGPVETRRFAAGLGLTAVVAVAVISVLMLFDVHLTMRGPADALFPMLALLTVPALWTDERTYRDAIIRPIIGLGRRP